MVVVTLLPSGHHCLSLAQRATNLNMFTLTFASPFSAEFHLKIPPNTPNTILDRLTFVVNIPQIRSSDGFDSGVCHFSSIGQVSDCWGLIGQRSVRKDITATKKGFVWVYFVEMRVEEKRFKGLIQ
ncbi:hypothetical protein V6N12_040360 [Hibiscus sabdariffa]|uniref:Uncharacterized protein n=1 Tax=Hibiscus sabdariffa TaxID=183260 RepID=A0ABR2E3G0_9ROSI